MKVEVLLVLFLAVVSCNALSNQVYQKRRLLQASCSNQSDCVPPIVINETIPSNVVDCLNSECICRDCFERRDGTCFLRECRFYTAAEGCLDNRKSQLTAILLSVFLSGVGAANFYIDRDGLAAGQLVLFLFVTFSSCAMCFPLCFVCCCKDEKKAGAIMMAYFCIITILVVLCSFAQLAWWIADLVIFANNDRDDGSGCQLRPA